MKASTRPAAAPVSTHRAVRRETWFEPLSHTEQEQLVALLARVVEHAAGA